MNLSWSLILLLLGPSRSADQLVELKADGVSFQVPAAWEKKVEVEGHSFQFSAPSEDARFEFSVMKVEPRRSPQKCVEEMLAVLGKGWELARAGRKPAARMKTTERKDKLVVETRSYVGCDGTSKWVMTWAFAQSKEQRFSALADKVFESIRYRGKAP